MARSIFGGTHLDMVLGAYQFGSRRLLALQSSATLTFWDAATGGTQYTDLLLDGSPVSSIVTDADGFIPEFQGPDGVTVMWVDDGDGTRHRLVTSDAIPTVEKGALNGVATLDGSGRIEQPVDHLVAADVADTGSATRGALDGAFVPNAAHRVLDAVADYGVVVGGGASSADMTANTTALNQALSDLLAAGGGVLQLPEGVVRINGELNALEVASDTIAGVVVRGTGAGILSRIDQSDDTKDIFVLSANTGNLRGLLFDTFELWGGKRQFYLNRASYNQWRNVRQRQAKEWAIFAEGGANYNTFTQHWVYETPTGNAVNANGSAVLTFVGSTFGEFCGLIKAGATVRLIGCTAFGIEDRIDTTGPTGAGATAFSVSPSGTLQIVGGSYSFNKNGIYTSNPGSILISGADIKIPTGYDLIHLNLRTTDSPVVMQGCTVRFVGDGSLVKRLSGGRVTATAIAGNSIQITTGATVTVDDDLIAAERGNRWDSNVVVRS